ncbi:MAG: DUF2207 domain-containing protein [Bacilli bacterium]|nr:DUF2207 domain-containing protein [Bacilli bacterium]
MKKFFIKGYVFIIAILLGLFIFTNVVNAENYASDFINVNNIPWHYIGEDITITNVYFSTSKPPIAYDGPLRVINGDIINKTGYDLKANVNIDYYNSSYQKIATSTNIEKPTEKDYRLYVYIDDINFLNNYGVDDISFFKISYNTIRESTAINNSSSNSMNSSSNLNTTTTKKPSQNSQYSSYDYVIDKYNIDIVVNENNTFNITETITAYFNIPKHGIFRTIPLKNTITRLDGTTSKNRVQISNLSVDNEYTTSRENGNYKIKIGSASRTLTGEQTYVIKYTYNIGKDPIKDYDELYYNIIGRDWDTVIGNVTFNIIMPKEFDSSKLGFSSGSLGSTNNSNVKYNVEGNKITGSYNGILRVGEALTIRSELPEGYFVGAGLAINFMDYVMFLIPILFLGVAILLWYKFGRDDQVVETVEFYPPTGFNSLEVGFLYKGKAENQDVTSLLIYLANKGYIKISETEEKSLFSKSKGFKITKLKEYDGNNLNEQIFLNGLFTKRASFTSLFNKTPEPPTNNINEVTSMDLYDNFYITIRKILSNINNKENKNKIFEKSASEKTVFIILMIIATYCLITIPPVFTYGEPATLIFALLFPGIGFSVMFSMLFGGTQTIYVNGRATHSSIGTKLFGLVWGGMFGGMPWIFMVFPALLQDFTYLIGYVIGLGCVLGMVICIKYLPKRTPYGNEILGKLMGFRNFLETAEKDRLEAMVMQDPTYFYNILPYTYVLGVSDKWIKKFETISLQAPSWYDSPTGFSVVTFGTFMNSTMTSAQSVMSSSSSSASSGGSSSGGGSSGGGSGGGGGGSW